MPRREINLKVLHWRCADGNLWNERVTHKNFPLKLKLETCRAAAGENVQTHRTRLLMSDVPDI
jgi:hypothetical protein